ncbi:MAG: hypothetical protein ACKOS8_10035, partial [Gemmataceae bacterium]
LNSQASLNQSSNPNQTHPHSQLTPATQTHSAQVASVIPRAHTQLSKKEATLVRSLGANVAALMKI